MFTLTTSNHQALRTSAKTTALSSIEPQYLMFRHKWGSFPPAFPDALSDSFTPVYASLALFILLKINSQKKGSADTPARFLRQRRRT
jgi:hypothetical protein